MSSSSAYLFLQVYASDSAHHHCQVGAGHLAEVLFYHCSSREGGWVGE